MINMDAVLLGLKKISGTPEIRLRAAPGEGAHLKQGDMFEVALPKSSANTNVVNIGGKPMTLLGGIPNALMGKDVQMKVVILGQQIALEVVAEKANNGQQKNMLDEGKNPKFTPASTTPNTDVRKGVKGKAIQAQLSSALPAMVKHKSVFHAVVQKTIDKKTVLEVMPSHMSKKQALRDIPLTALAGKNTSSELSRQFSVDTLSKSLQQGEMFRVQVQKGHALKPMLLLEPMAKKAVLPLPALNQAPQKQLLTAAVHQRLSNGNIVFEWSGQSYETKAPAYIQVGDTLVLQSDMKANQLSIEVVDVVKKVNQKALQLMRQAHSKSDPIGQVIQSLSQMKTAGGNVSAKQASELLSLGSLLQNFQVTDDMPLDGARLASMIKNSGLFHESVLGQLLKDLGRTNQREVSFQPNLKSTLMRLAESDEQTQRSTQYRHVQQAAELGVNRIESQQALNLMALHQTEPMRFELPMMIHGQFTTVQMAVLAQQAEAEFEEEDSQNQVESFNVLFALDLSSLGPLRIDARISEQSVVAGMYSELNTSREFIQEHLGELQGRLLALGFKDVQLSVSSELQMSGKKAEQFELLTAGLPISQGLLDVRG